jgi:hypothetical protein
MSIENARRIENAVLVSLPEDRVPDEGMILELATRLQIVFPIDDAEFQDVLKKLHSKLAITMDTGVALVGEEHAPWLSARKAAIEPFYWERFQHFLQKKDWPPKVVSTLDRVTDEVLDLLGDPAKPGPWKRRGLVLGDVQSGKTATYTAVTCKAGDAGYKLIILLTGTLETLRRQTQERLDEGFVGLDSSGILNQIKSNRAVGVGLVDSRKSAGVFTSREKDFSKTLLNALGFRLDAFNVPVLVVVKKNKRILENLERWLTDFNAGSNHTIDIPMLLIDDEADSASVNTNPMAVDPTAINKRIRALLRLFTRSSYIGFTATPFANIFIDPDTEHEMLGDDLFPRDFIYTLEPPSNYVGPGVLFGEEPVLQICRKIDDADDVFPPKHKASLSVEALPESLRSAIHAFILTTTLRDLRHEGPSHRSMLVNVSRFTAVQDQVAALIHAYVSRLQQDVRNYSQLPEVEALRNRSLSELRETWDAEFATSEFDWLQVQRALLNAALPITVKAVNQRTGAASLDYAKHRENGLRVIAVGGNSLSRGLTLEGLSTSYFFRSSQMYDTLLQMGRWFGYRDGYTDLCRLWLTDEAAQWYSHITLATEELRYEVKRMRQRNATPKEFGLKVRAHPDSLIVTAQNKMRLAHTIERVISISGQGLETSRLKNSRPVIRSNKNAVLRFVETIEKQGARRETSPWGNTIWRSVSKDFVISLLREFEVHPFNIAFQSDDLANYFEKTAETALQLWDVVIAKGGQPPITFGGIRVRPAKRFVSVREGAILVSGSKARVGSRGIEREGLPEELVREIEETCKREKRGNVSDRMYRERRKAPLLLIHLVDPYGKDEKRFDTGGDELLALGLSLPVFDDSDVAGKVNYRVNLVEWRAMLEEAIDDDAPGDDDDAG